MQSWSGISEPPIRERVNTCPIPDHPLEHWGPTDTRVFFPAPAQEHALNLQAASQLLPLHCSSILQSSRLLVCQHPAASPSSSGLIKVGVPRGVHPLQPLCSSCLSPSLLPSSPSTCCLSFGRATRTDSSKPDRQMSHSSSSTPTFGRTHCQLSSLVTQTRAPAAILVTLHPGAVCFPAHPGPRTMWMNCDPG